MKTASVLLFLSLTQVFAVAAQARVVLTCEPASFRPWPNNAHVKVVENASGKLTLFVTTSYYGALFPSEYSVRAVDGGYQGAEASLRLTQTSKGSLARLESKVEGTQNLVCW